MRIIITEDAFRGLVAGKTVAIGRSLQAIELRLSQHLTWKQLAQALIDAVDAQQHPPDPPEAREFLSRRRGTK